MGFRTRSRSGSNCSLESIDNYATKKRKLKNVKEDLVAGLKKVVEEKTNEQGALVIAEETAEPKGKNKLKNQIKI